MQLLRLVCAAFAVSVAHVNAAGCPYKGVITSIEPCAGDQQLLFEIDKVRNVRLTGNNCNVEITGCADIKQTIKTLNCKYVATKEKMEVAKGNQNVFELTVGKTQVKPPLKKGKFCLKEETVKNPVGRMGMVGAVGNIGAQVECVSDNGVKQCVKGTGKVSRTLF